MKTLILILTILVTLNVKAQGGYKMYSKVWVLTPMNGGYYLSPKGNTSFSSRYIDSVRKNINAVKINSYLLKSFNEFRKDYGSSLVVESPSTSLKCQNYSKNLSFDFSHDKSLTEDFECIARIDFTLLTNIKKSDGDFNKIVSECIFDIFVTSYSHTKSLLGNYTKCGFGYTIINDVIYIVVRGIK